MDDVQNGKVHEETTVSDVAEDRSVKDGKTSPGGAPRTRGSAGRFGHRRSPTTGHRVRRHKTPEPNFVTPPELKEKQGQGSGRSLSSPREGEHRRISSSEEEEERKPRRVAKQKPSESTKTKLEASKKWSGMSLTAADVISESNIPKPALRTRSKSRSKETNEDKYDTQFLDKGSWWKSWPSWTQRIRGKSLEREIIGETPIKVPPRRNKSLERPPVIKEKEKRAAQEKPPVAKKRSKSKSRTVSDEEKRASVEESSDEFWKSEVSLRKRQMENIPSNEAEKSFDISSREGSSFEDLTKALVLLKPLEMLNEPPSIIAIEAKPSEKEKLSLIDLYRDILSEWKSFITENIRDVRIIQMLRNKCFASFVILVIYCGSGAIIFRFTEGAFESFYKCGVKRVKRDFVDSLWLYSHSLREEEWKSMARRKLMEFEEQLHTAYEAGSMSYSGLKAWSFLNSFIYCLTVVTTIGYGHISPSTTTGRVITIIYAIFGIPMFLILLADFGKLFTRGIKFVWAFVRRVYYTGSCRKVRRTVPVQEMMKGVQMVYDIATFRRPSQLPPGVMLDEAAGPPLPPRVYTPGEPPGTPALSTFAIDDEFNLPISVAIFILLIYIICGATVFYIWESWGFFESFYFVFISMSTIGFGDFVPQNQMYMMASIVYLVFGLALTSMCINVVQEKLSDSFRQASAKIGATIGLRVAEEDGAVTPSVPAPVEMPQVHRSNHTTSPSTPPFTVEVNS